MFLGMLVVAVAFWLFQLQGRIQEQNESTSSDLARARRAIGPVQPALGERHAPRKGRRRESRPSSMRSGTKINSDRQGELDDVSTQVPSAERRSTKLWRPAQETWSSRRTRHLSRAELDARNRDSYEKSKPRKRRASRSPASTKQATRQQYEFSRRTRRRRQESARRCRRPGPHCGTRPIPAGVAVRCLCLGLCRRLLLFQTPRRRAAAWTSRGSAPPAIDDRPTIASSETADDAWRARHCTRRRSEQIGPRSSTRLISSRSWFFVYILVFTIGLGPVARRRPARTRDRRHRQAARPTSSSPSPCPSPARRRCSFTAAATGSG